MEVHIKQPCPAFQREIKSFFSDEKLENVTVVLCLQDSRCSFIEFRGDEEKDECLERFFRFAEDLSDRLNGFWCDFVDPSSGLVVKSENYKVFSDVETCIRLMKMEYVSCGGCGMVKHEKFGFSVYPSTFFTNANGEVVKRAVEEVVSGWKDVKVCFGESFINSL